MHALESERSELDISSKHACVRCYCFLPNAVCLEECDWSRCPLPGSNMRQPSKLFRISIHNQARWKLMGKRSYGRVPITALLQVCVYFFSQMCMCSFSFSSAACQESSFVGHLLSWCTDKTLGSFQTSKGIVSHKVSVNVCVCMCMCVYVMYVHVCVCLI